MLKVSTHLKYHKERFPEDFLVQDLSLVFIGQRLKAGKILLFDKIIS